MNQLIIMHIKRILMQKYKIQWKTGYVSAEQLSNTWKQNGLYDCFRQFLLEKSMPKACIFLSSLYGVVSRIIIII